MKDKRQYFLSQNGLTLVEILVAMLILSIIAVSFISILIRVG